MHVVQYVKEKLRSNVFTDSSRPAHPRRFLINYHYNGCPNDNGWTTVTEGKACEWDKPTIGGILFISLVLFFNFPFQNIKHPLPSWVMDV